jgi:2-polyprenyl-3-methyl-5-hydroxy-6-metoxy-1,4-benzoquinol methylase
MLENTDPKSSTQERNRSWWNRTPMSYDWRQKITLPEGSLEFFDEVDARFCSSSPYYLGSKPFGQFIPFERLKGKRVLEIGCGLGLHSQLIAQAGANLTSIDLTPRAAGLTTKRFELKELKSDVRVMDAENLQFDENEFDLVWSWGVIHHSAKTERIVDEVFRVLRPGGEFRSMVYHRRSINALGMATKGFLTGKFLKGMSAQDIFNIYSDGYIARHYTVSQYANMLRSSGLVVSSSRIVGQKTELLPFPGNGVLGTIKQALVRLIPNSLAVLPLSKIGGFLFVCAEKPV